jgi:hypothetical protein
MRGIKTLKIVLDNLSVIDLPSLPRPPVRRDEARTNELIEWGIRMYVYSLILHLRKVLSGLVQLGESGNIAASAPVSRHVFEWAAVSCVLASELRKQLEQHDYDGAWKLLTQIATGSHWVRKHGTKYPVNPPIASLAASVDPIYVPQAVKEYEAYQAKNGMEAEAIESYSFLCDFAHANAACLLRYQEYKGAVTQFIDPDQNPGAESFLPFVNRCLIDLLTFLHELLGLAADNTVQPKIYDAIKHLARLAPPALTKSVPA